MFHTEAMRMCFKHLESNTPHHTLLSLDDYHKQKFITCKNNLVSP